MARLGDLERKVMEILWSDSGHDLTARQVEARLPGYAYTTLLTVLDRLCRKGLATRRKGNGRALHYAATTSKEDYIAELMRDALGTASDRDAALVRFVESVSATDAAALREALHAAENGEPDSVDPVP
jgi:predicted transcriptional regulator